MPDAVSKVIGRMLDDDSLDERASTKEIGSVTVPYEGGAVGAVTVAVLTSQDDEDRGGVVLRITSEDVASSFIAHAQVLENGVELHMAGDIEGRSLINALRGALALLP